VHVAFIDGNFLDCHKVYAHFRHLVTILSVPLHNLNFGSRTFSVSSPSIWNTLPLYFRGCKALIAFRRNVKTRRLKSPFTTP